MKKSFPVIILLACANQTCFAHSSTWEIHMAAGREHWSKGEYSLADKDYSLALKESEKLGQEDIELAVILNQIAFAHIVQHKVEESKPFVDHAMKIWDKELSDDHRATAGQLKAAGMTFNNLGVLYLGKDKNEDAERMFSEAIKLNPKYNLPYLNRSITRKRLGDTKGADEDETEGKRIGRHD
jgi:tetratricopeptide (TPR) repeat protein